MATSANCPVITCHNCESKDCRKSFLLLKKKNKKPNEESDFKSGDSGIDSFIEDTQIKSINCKDFIKWIPAKRIDNLQFITSGGFSNIYSGYWNLSFNNNNNSVNPKLVVIKVLKDLPDEKILNEVKRIFITI